MYRQDRRFTLLAFFVFLLLAIAPMVATGAQADKLSRADFHDEMRRLWEDHIVWTRLYIVSAVEELPDLDATTQRLLANQDDIGNAVKPFYGDEAGAALSDLLRDHILGAAALLTAAKAGDEAGVTAASEAWSANADAIAAFLNSANPDHWPLDVLTHEMHMHLDFTLREAQARLAGDYTAEIAAYDEVHQHILSMADVLSQGLIEQFPEMFNA